MLRSDEYVRCIFNVTEECVFSFSNSKWNDYLVLRNRLIFKSEFCCLKFRMTSSQTDNIFQNKEVVKTPPEKKCGLMVG
jgi:hypothetical protein